MQYLDAGSSTVGYSRVEWLRSGVSFSAMLQEKTKFIQRVSIDEVLIQLISCSGAKLTLNAADCDQRSLFR